jgi:hypothetical protein
MKKIPEWLASLAKDYECPKCHLPIDINRIMSLGVKESHKYKGREVVFFEYFCDSCQDSCIFELDFTDSDGFIPKMIDSLFEQQSDENIEEIVDEYYGQNKEKMKEKREKRSGITDSEIKNMKKFLSNCKHWEDFLGEIGLTTEQIEKYSVVDKKE